MKKRFSIYHFLIAVLIFSMFTPLTSVFAGKDSPKGSLTIYKYEQEKGTERSEGDGTELSPYPEGEPLEGVEFTFTKTHAYDPETDTWTAVNETSFTETTDSDGKIFLDNIALGRYEVQETNGPEHVDLNTKTFKVDIPMTSKDGSNLSYDVFIYPKNDIIRGDATIIKFANDSEETLSGVKFQVFHANGDPVLDDDGNEIVITTSDGKASVSGLAYGEYYFQEIETIDGYMLNGKKVKFSITEQGQSVEVDLQNYDKPDVTKEVDKTEVNRGETVTFTITVDLPLDIQDYERFVIKDELDERLEFIDGSQSQLAGFTFNADGQKLTWTGESFADMQPGSMTITFDAKVKEDAAANEPIPNEASIDYNTKYDDGSDKTPPVEVTPTVGSLSVKKIDGDNEKGLSGAEFILINEAGDIVASGISGSDGIVNFNGETDELDYGNYTLEETKAPENYNLLRNPIEFTIDKEKSEVSLTVKNYKSDWELPKTGGIGTTLFTAIGTLLMGLAFYLYTRRRKKTA